MRIAFLVNDLNLSGGVNVIVKHAGQLATLHGHEVSIVLVGRTRHPEWMYPELRSVLILHVDQIRDEEYDLLILTWWETVFNVGLVRARAVVWFVQSLEDRFYEPGDPMQWMARMAYACPIPVITEATWIEKFFNMISPDRPTRLVLNGIDKTLFNCHGRREAHKQTLRVLIEGSVSSGFKGVRQSFAVVEQLRENVSVTWVTPNGDTTGCPMGIHAIGPLSAEEMADTYRQTDVLLKLSRVEGMFGPPLEAFHCGATAVVTPVTGGNEYIRHRQNAIVTNWDDSFGAAYELDELARNFQKLESLRAGAIITAEKWPDWRESTHKFNEAIQQLVHSPRTPSSAEISWQVGLLRSIRAPLRIMHDNSIDTLKVALSTIDEVQHLKAVIRRKDNTIRDLETAGDEREWWNKFKGRLLVRVLLKMRSITRKLRRRTSRHLQHTK